jgi:hypothetical protein
MTRRANRKRDPAAPTVAFGITTRPTAVAGAASEDPAAALTGTVGRRVIPLPRTYAGVPVAKLSATERDSVAAAIDAERRRQRQVEQVGVPGVGFKFEISFFVFL